MPPPRKLEMLENTSDEFQLRRAMIYVIEANERRIMDLEEKFKDVDTTLRGDGSMQAPGLISIVNRIDRIMINQTRLLWLIVTVTLSGLIKIMVDYWFKV